MSEQPIILMHRRGGMLVPHGPMDDELVRSFPANVPLRVRLTAPRNPRSLRYYFALLSLVRENLPEPAPSVEVLHEAIKVLLGYTITVKTARGDIVLPGSVAFDRMEEPEFHKYLEAFKQLVVTRIIPGLDMPAFEKAAREMLGDPIEPTRRRAIRDETKPGPDESPERYDTPPPPDDDEDEDDGPPENGADPFGFGADEDEGDDSGPFDPDAGADAAEIALTRAEAFDQAPTNVDDVIRVLAERAARQGRPRELPPGLTNSEGLYWLNAYDAVMAARSPPAASASEPDDDSGPPTNARPEQPSGQEPAGLAPGETVDPETGEVTEIGDPPVTVGVTAEVTPPPPDDDADAEGLAGVSAAQDRAELDSGVEAVQNCTTWPALKALYRARLESDWYAECEAEGRRMYRSAVWDRWEELTQDGPAGRTSPVQQDYDAMWLWLEFGAKTKDEIDAAWPTFWRHAAYTRASSDDQTAIAGLMIERQKAMVKGKR